MAVNNLYGCGYGACGYGDGNGNGNGDEFLKLLALSIICIDKAKKLEKEGATIAFWKSKKDGTPSNGGHGTPAFIGKTEVIKGPLKLCTAKALHATFKPDKWKGERLWVVALYPPVHFDDDKCGSLKREILVEMPYCL